MARVFAFQLGVGANDRGALVWIYKVRVAPFQEIAMALMLLAGVVGGGAPAHAQFEPDDFLTTRVVAPLKQGKLNTQKGGALERWRSDAYALTQIPSAERGEYWKLLGATFGSAVVAYDEFERRIAELALATHEVKVARWRWLKFWQNPPKSGVLGRRQPSILGRGGESLHVVEVSPVHDVFLRPFDVRAHEAWFLSEGRMFGIWDGQRMLGTFVVEPVAEYGATRRLGLRWDRMSDQEEVWEQAGFERAEIIDRVFEALRKKMPADAERLLVDAEVMEGLSRSWHPAWVLAHAEGQDPTGRWSLKARWSKHQVEHGLLQGDRDIWLALDRALSQPNLSFEFRRRAYDLVRHIWEYGKNATVWNAVERFLGFDEKDARVDALATLLTQPGWIKSRQELLELIALNAPSDPRTSQESLRRFYFRVPGGHRVVAVEPEGLEDTARQAISSRNPSERMHDLISILKVKGTALDDTVRIAAIRALASESRSGAKPLHSLTSYEMRILLDVFENGSEFEGDEAVRKAILEVLMDPGVMVTDDVRRRISTGDFVGLVFAVAGKNAKKLLMYDVCADAFSKSFENGADPNDGGSIRELPNGSP